MGRLVSFVGDERPGGLKELLEGEGDLAAAGVVGREFRMFDAGRAGGPIRLSRVAALDPRLLAGDGEGDMLDNVSIVRSLNEGLGLRLLKSKVSGLSTTCAEGFSLPSSKTGRPASALGGVVSSATDSTA
jgi:hypothetical protein